MGVMVSSRPGERLGVLLTGWVDRLPPPLRRLLPPEFVGYWILGTVTLCLDLGLLAVLRATTPLPLAVAVSIAYLTAFGLNYLLNRTVNFRSRAPVGGEMAKFIVIAVVDYLLTLGVTTGLSALGVDFRIARLTGSICVALVTYVGSKWWVFRDPRPKSGPAAPVAAAQHD
jgi:putative flippase GtrA